MIVRRKFYLGDDQSPWAYTSFIAPSGATVAPSAPAPAPDYQSLPSSDLLNQQAIGPSVINSGPAALPAVAPQPLTEDEIAEQYGGNPIVAAVQKAATANPLALGALVVGIGLVAFMMSRSR